jgi:hypothetical protein
LIGKGPIYKYARLVSASFKDFAQWLGIAQNFKIVVYNWSKVIEHGTQPTVQEIFYSKILDKQV